MYTYTNVPIPYFAHHLNNRSKLSVSMDTKDNMSSYIFYLIIRYTTKCWIISIHSDQIYILIKCWGSYTILVHRWPPNLQWIKCWGSYTILVHRWPPNLQWIKCHYKRGIARGQLLLTWLSLMKTPLNLLCVRVGVFNATFNNISVISWCSELLVEETGVPGENPWPTASDWHTASQKIVSSTSRLSGILTHNASGDRH